jgi:GT2 family glycosyltransferase
MEGNGRSNLDLSIVIVSWNTRDILDACLASVFADLTHSSNLSGEVWLVDNASSDGSARMVREKYPQVRLVENRENVGFARANNQVIPLCAGRWVILLNSDALICENAFTALLAAADADPAIGIVGPLLLNRDGTIQPSWSRFAGPLREFLGRRDRSEAPDELRATHTPPSHVLAPFSSEWLEGACLVARRAAVEAVGLLDGGYFMYCEETDWCLRFRQGGWDIRLVPDARVVHLRGQSSRLVPRATRERLAASKVRYYQQHGHLWDVWQARMLSALFLRRSKKRSISCVQRGAE